MDQLTRPASCILRAEGFGRIPFALESPAWTAHDPCIMGDRPGSGFLTPVETRRSVRDEIVRQLRALESDLRSRGVCGLSLFGSIARGDAGLDSDIDVIVELDPDAHVDLFDLSGLRIDLSRRLGREIDIVTRHDRMKPRFAEHIRDDEVRVF